MDDLKRLFEASQLGDKSAADKLFGSLYDDLRRIAHARLRGHDTPTLLNTTGLVHESYLRFLQAGKVDISNRAHFLAYSARAMRSIIVDAMRKRLADRRGGDAQHVTLNTELEERTAAPETEVVRVSEAVDELARLDARLAQVVEMKFFAGLTEIEIAQALGLTERTVRRDWEKARLFLYSAVR
jgi:RNA polymerase sigma factor (TIGR02999 family)